MEPTTANKFAQIWISNSLTNAMGPRLLAITLTFTEEVPALNRNGGTELFFASKEWKSLNVACSCCLWGGNFYAFSVTHSSHVLVGVCTYVGPPSLELHTIRNPCFLEFISWYMARIRSSRRGETFRVHLLGVLDYGVCGSPPALR